MKWYFAISSLLIFSGCGMYSTSNFSETNRVTPLPSTSVANTPVAPVAVCYYEEVGNSKNATVLTVVKGGNDQTPFTAITTLPNGAVISKVPVIGGVSQSSLRVPLAIYVAPLYVRRTPYNISIWVWPNATATGEVETPPVLPGLENHKEKIACTSVDVNP